MGWPPKTGCGEGEGFVVGVNGGDMVVAFERLGTENGEELDL